MKWFHRIFQRRKLTADLSEEMRQYLDEKIESFIAAGMSREDAIHAARRAFGNAALIEQRSREVWMWPFIESLGADIKFALRQLKKSPGFTLTVILTLALGIGANSAIFSLTYAILLKSLPVPNPNLLVEYSSNGSPLSGPTYDALRQQVAAADVMAWGTAEFTRASNGSVANVRGALMSGNGFAVLQLQPYIGRTFGEQDDVPGGGPHGYQALLEYSYWNNEFHADPNVIGTALTINGRKVTVIGVLPRQFRSAVRGQTANIVLPLAFDEVLHPRDPRRHANNYWWLTVLGRLRNGQTLQSARSSLAVVTPQVRKAADPKHMWGDPDYIVDPGRMGNNGLGDKYRQPLLLLELLAGLLLALCCANLALLLMARSSERTHEFAVRGALGASRAKLFNHVLLEILLLACAGVLGGYFLGTLLAHSLTALLGGGPAERHLDAAPNLIVFACATGATFLTAFLAALIPAIHASHTMPALDLKQAHTGTRKVRGGWIVAVQIALSLVLTTSALWLGTTFLHLFLENSGFQPHNVVFAEFGDFDSKQSPAQIGQQKLEILSRIEHMPGVVAATWVSVPPLTGSSTWAPYMSRDRHGATHQDSLAWPEQVNTDYFAALGTRIIEGRGFVPRDRESGMAVCVLSASAASHFFPTEDPLGREIYSGDKPDPKNACTIVGVAADAHFFSLRTPPERVVYDLIQSKDHGAMGFYLVIRASNPTLAMHEIRAIAHSVSPTTAPPKTVLFSDTVAATFTQERLLVRLSTGFSALALLLMGVGLFGMLARRVTERTREIGIRIAFGAPRAAVLRAILSSVAIQVCVGIAMGAGCAILVGRAMHSLLYETSANSLGIYFGSVTAIFLVCVFAAFMPARRAASVDPMQALRAE